MGFAAIKKKAHALFDEAGFISSAHTTADIDETISKAAEVFASL